jgi:hypothetical protein
MGYTSEIFAASKRDLLTAFQGWVIPTYGGLRNETVRHPLTGQPIQLPSFGDPVPSTAPPLATNVQAALRTLRELNLPTTLSDEGIYVTHVIALGIALGLGHQVSLGALKRAVLGPRSCGLSVHQIPSELSQALSNLDPANVGSVATAWEQRYIEQMEKLALDTESAEPTEGWQEALLALAALAKRSEGSGRNLYVWEG